MCGSLRFLRSGNGTRLPLLRPLLSMAPTNLRMSTSIRSGPTATAIARKLNEANTIAPTIPPRWPLQIPPPVATPNSSRQDGRSIGGLRCLGWVAQRRASALGLGPLINWSWASEARQAEGIGRGAVGRPRTPQGLSTGSSCGQVACPRRARVRRLLEGLHCRLVLGGCNAAGVHDRGAAVRCSDGERTQTACAIRAAASLSR